MVVSNNSNHYDALIPSEGTGSISDIDGLVNTVIQEAEDLPNNKLSDLWSAMWEDYKQRNPTYEDNAPFAVEPCT